jgi:hypothetical protein
MREDAVRLLKVREGDVARGLPVTPKIGRLRFDEAAEDVLNDYRVNGKRSLDDVQRRFTLHLTPFFGGRRLSTVTTPDVRVYVAQRQAAGASNATVNRELTVLKRAFSLALQSGKLLAKPHIPMLHENNARTGFFEADQLASVLAHLPAPIQPVIRFAAITGWRIADEVLPLEWRQVDLPRAKCDSTSARRARGASSRRRTTNVYFPSPRNCGPCSRPSTPSTCGSNRPDRSRPGCSCG